MTKKHRKPRRMQPMQGPHTHLVGMTIEEFVVGSWCRSQDGSGEPEAVSMQFKIHGNMPDLFLRLKSPAAVDEMVQALLRHKRDVWPEAL